VPYLSKTRRVTLEGEGIEQSRRRIQQGLRLREKRAVKRKGKRAGSSKNGLGKVLIRVWAWGEKKGGGATSS